MTEDEAKTKWCPFANQGAVTAFRIVTASGSGSSQHTCCIGSACMAWRGALTPDFKRRADTAFRRDGARITATGDDIEGWCGLASPISVGAQ